MVLNVKRNRAETDETVSHLLLTSLTPYRWAKPAHHVHRSHRVQLIKDGGHGWIEYLRLAR